MKTEFELAVSAQNGNQKDLETLWNMYKKPCANILYCVAHMETEELESEAFMLFHHKLMNVFKPEKIGVSQDSWTFSFMVLGGVKNLRSKLINESERQNKLSCFSYREANEEDSFYDNNSQDAINVAMFGKHTYDVYNPEALVISSQVPISERVHDFYSKLSAFEKSVLEERRAGLKLQQIADKFGCSLSKVKSHLKIAKEIASSSFEVQYA